MNWEAVFWTVGPFAAYFAVLSFLAWVNEGDQ